ncbi:DUF4349 domain-containing protein [Ruoffia tabacinasalis]|uniref:DUF4349 domain-containing protein n=1 Tax=Ruoffia tabacinasalis TaxID=87458 RepID=UPI0030CA62D8
MKKWKWGILFLTVFLLYACESQEQSTTTYPDANYTTEMAQETDENVSRQQINEDREIIYTANVIYQTIRYDEAKQSIEEIIEANDAYIQYQDESRNQYSYAESSQSLTSLSLTIRVPRDNYEETLTQFENNDQAQLIQLTRGSQDVTQQVQDIELRIEAIDSRIDRLNELNDQAESVTDLIEIQGALEEAIASRDSLLAEQTSVSTEVENATIHLNLQEVVELSDGSESQLTFWDKIIATFNDTWENSIEAFQWGILTLIFLIPYIMVVFIIILIVRYILRPLFKKLKSVLPKRKEKAISETNREKNNFNTKD